MGLKVAWEVKGVLFLRWIWSVFELLEIVQVDRERLSLAGERG